MDAQHAFAQPTADTAEVCACGAAYVDGFHLQVVKLAHLAAHGAEVRVTFRPDSPQHAANDGIVYVVEGEPHVDATHGDQRLYVWLVAADDMALPRSRQRRRSGYLTALQAA